MSGAWVGMDEVMHEITAMTVRAQAAAKQAVTGSALIVERAAKANFEGSHRKGQPHVGGPDSYPNVVSGTLRRSIRHSPTTPVGLGEYVSTVAPTTEYGRRVELGWPGTANHGHPFFGPAVDSTHTEIGIFATSCWNRVREGGP